jgi:histidinol-phosphatase (PHP family)
MIYRTDYHIHTLFSDGKSNAEDYLIPALSAGLSEIGFSEHLTLFREKQDRIIDPQRVSEYIKSIDILRKKTKTIEVRTGFEVDYYSGREEDLHSFLKKIKLDYIIGSVHYLEEKTVDNGPEFYEGKDIDRLFINYFDLVQEAASSGLFDIIAHCDLIRIYGYQPTFNPEYLYRNLAKCFKKHDVVFEINTNGRNKPLGDFYPDRRFLNIFQEEGVAVCVNSDAHFPARVAQYFEEAYELLKNAGYSEMAVFKNRERYMIPFDL